MIIRLPVGPIPSVVVSQLKADWYSSVDNDHDENLALVAPSDDNDDDDDDELMMKTWHS